MTHNTDNKVKNLLTAAAAILILGTLSACSESSDADADTAAEDTPEACIAALNAAEELVQGPMTENTEDMILLVGLVPQAMEAGMLMDVSAAERITGDIEDMNLRVETRTSEIERIVAEYNTNAEKCRGTEGAEGAEGVNG